MRGSPFVVTVLFVACACSGQAAVLYRRTAGGGKEYVVPGSLTVDGAVHAQRISFLDEQGTEITSLDAESARSIRGAAAEATGLVDRMREAKDKTMQALVGNTTSVGENSTFEQSIHNISSQMAGQLKELHKSRGRLFDDRFSSLFSLERTACTSLSSLADALPFDVANLEADARCSTAQLTATAAAAGETGINWDIRTRFGQQFDVSAADAGATLLNVTISWVMLGGGLELTDANSPAMMSRVQQVYDGMLSSVLTAIDSDTIEGLPCPNFDLSSLAAPVIELQQQLGIDFNPAFNSTDVQLKVAGSDGQCEEGGEAVSLQGATGEKQVCMIPGLSEVLPRINAVHAQLASEESLLVYGCSKSLSAESAAAGGLLLFLERIQA
uniref:Uncharacterized protein n=1 Tax=Palpitomonas bilix TaxID=652834 RepID=A0A7S3FYF6_9EUKA|mmetsp:Transcript_10646/g.27865  ORF Transcript_10646/g.27865 Transcript_10646/m.27865 type:complete len:384 (+) Transcript_10646:78-1229(+)